MSKRFFSKHNIIAVVLCLTMVVTTIPVMAIAEIGSDEMIDINSSPKVNNINITENE